MRFQFVDVLCHAASLLDQGYSLYVRRLHQATYIGEGNDIRMGSLTFATSFVVPDPPPSPHSFRTSQPFLRHFVIMRTFIATLLATVALLTACMASVVPWERLDKNNSMLLILDLQDGLYGLARDFDPTVYHNAMIAHAAVGKLFDIPVVMTTSAQTGPNGPLPKAILDM